MKISLSVVIPTLNEEHFLPNLLSDLAKQTYTDFEVIVVDGKSDDKTKELALKFKSKLDFTFLECDKRHVSCQRNMGAQNATGSYVFFIDADSRMNPTYLQKVYKNIQKHPSLMYLPTLISQKKNSKINGLIKFVMQIVQFSQMTNRPLSTLGSMLIERNFFSFLGGFDEHVYIGEDNDIVFRAKKAGITARLIKDVHLKMSERRMEKEGYIRFMAKHAYSTFYELMQDQSGVREKIFEYPMGGGHYQKNDKKGKWNQARFKKMLKELIK